METVCLLCKCSFKTAPTFPARLGPPRKTSANSEVVPLCWVWLVLDYSRWLGSGEPTSESTCGITGDLLFLPSSSSPLFLSLGHLPPGQAEAERGDCRRRPDRGGDDVVGCGGAKSDPLAFISPRTETKSLGRSTLLNNT